MLDEVVERLEPPRGRAPLSAYATAALEQADQQARAKPLVVVAHSAGGAVAAQLMAQAGDRVVGVLGVCAVIPRPGRSFAATMPLPARALLPVMLRLAGTRPPDGAIRKGLGAGLPEDVVRGLVEDYAAESRALFLGRTGAPVLPPVRRYLLATRDREVPPAVQRRSAATLQAQHVTEVTTGHLPLLEDPDAVLRELQELLDHVGTDGRPRSGAWPDGVAAAGLLPVTGSGQWCSGRPSISRDFAAR